MMHTPDSCADFGDRPHLTPIQEAVYCLDRTLLRLDAAQQADCRGSVNNFWSLLRRDMRRLVSYDATSQQDKLLRYDVLDRIRTLLGVEQDDYREAMLVMASRNSSSRCESDTTGSLAFSN